MHTGQQFADKEAEMFWAALQAFGAARRSEDDEEIRLCAAELEGFAMHSEQSCIRTRARTALLDRRSIVAA